MPQTNIVLKEFLNNINVINDIKKFNNHNDISIITGYNFPVSGVNISSTLGLSDYNINTLLQNNKELRVELVIPYANNFAKTPNILNDCATNIINNTFLCRLGIVFPNMLKDYYPNIKMKHILFTSPFILPNIKNIERESSVVTWLMGISISEKENDYIKNYGFSSLEMEFEKNNINIFDLERKSIF